MLTYKNVKEKVTKLYLVVIFYSLVILLIQMIENL